MSLSQSLMRNSDVYISKKNSLLSYSSTVFIFDLLCRCVVLSINSHANSAEKNLNRHTHTHSKCYTGICLRIYIKCNVCIASWEQHFGNGISIAQHITANTWHTHTSSAKVLSMRHMFKSTQLLLLLIFFCVCMLVFILRHFLNAATSFLLYPKNSNHSH